MVRVKRNDEKPVGVATLLKSEMMEVRYEGTRRYLHNAPEEGEEVLVRGLQNDHEWTSAYLGYADGWWEWIVEGCVVDADIDCDYEYIRLKDIDGMLQKKSEGA